MTKLDFKEGAFAEVLKKADDQRKQFLRTDPLYLHLRSAAEQACHNVLQQMRGFDTISPKLIDSLAEQVQRANGYGAIEELCWLARTVLQWCLVAGAVEMQRQAVMKTFAEQLAESSMARHRADILRTDSFYQHLRSMAVEVCYGVLHMMRAPNQILSHELVDDVERQVQHHAIMHASVEDLCAIADYLNTVFLKLVGCPEEKFNEMLSKLKAGQVQGVAEFKQTTIDAFL